MTTWTNQLSRSWIVHQCTGSKRAWATEPSLFLKCKTAGSQFAEEDNTDKPSSNLDSIWLDSSLVKSIHSKLQYILSQYDWLTIKKSNHLIWVESSRFDNIWLHSRLPNLQFELNWIELTTFSTLPVSNLMNIF